MGQPPGAECPNDGCTRTRNGAFQQYFATAHDGGYVTAGGQNTFLNPIKVLVAVQNQQTQGAPVQRNITYAVYKLDGTQLTPVTGSNEISLYERVLTGSAGICDPCSNFSVPDDYNLGVFNDEIRVAAFGGSPFSVSQNFLINDRDAPIFFPDSNGQYYGWYSQVVTATPTNISIRAGSQFVFQAGR